MAADAISFFRIGRDGLKSEMRRSGRAWKKLVAEFGESVYHCPAVARAVASEVQQPLYDGRYLGHHARTGSILIVKSCRVSKDERRESMQCRQLQCFSRSSLGCNRNGCRSYRGYPSSTTSNDPSAFDATSALCHKGRLEEIGCDDQLLSVC